MPIRLGRVLGAPSRTSRFVREPGTGNSTCPSIRPPVPLSAQCLANDTHDWLAVTIHADPADPRADDIPGDLVFNGKVVPDWGLHLVDMNLAMGNLVDLARTQGQAWLDAQNAE